MAEPAYHPPGLPTFPSVQTIQGGDESITVTLHADGTATGDPETLQRIMEKHTRPLGEGPGHGWGLWFLLRALREGQR